MFSVPHIYPLINLHNTNPAIKAFIYDALSLRALNRVDEAVLTLERIIDVAPDSLWGRLAQLHQLIS